MPLTNEGIFLTVDWRLKSTYFEIVLVWQFVELTTGCPGFPVLNFRLLYRYFLKYFFSYGLLSVNNISANLVATVF